MIAKRCLDFVVAAVAICGLAPLLVAVALWIRLDSPGPAIFRQTRVGHLGRPFLVWKFRTMRAGPAPAGANLTVGEDPRITGAGKWLRRWKFDELPQLFNVLKGEMSLVGPRPEVPSLLAHLPAEQARAMTAARPGITSPASIYYHNESELLAAASDPHLLYLSKILPRKLAFARHYVRRQSFLYDLRVIARTVCILARQR
jgi:lipopolysaccharide/colanic/teichoic acid biosynthesis glycosyltransferase